jgi:hypothetical protein
MSPLDLFLGPVLDRLFGTVKDLGGKYLDKQISKQEMDAAIEQARIAAEKDFEQAIIKAQEAMFEDVQVTVRTTPIIARAYAAVLALAAFVWVWSIIGVGAFKVIAGEAWPLLDQSWAVASSSALIMFCLGAGGYALRR